MKKQFSIVIFCCLAVLLLVFPACKDGGGTTTRSNDSTTALADSPKPRVDSPAVVNIPVDTKGADSLPTDNSRVQDPTKPDPVTTVYRLSVSFISIGEGIDYKAKEKYDSFIKDFAKRNKVKEPAHETVGWGREGETDYCFTLSELPDAGMQAAFVKESKALLAGNELVVLKENTKCRVPRK
jgi:hypothetical protein